MVKSSQFGEIAKLTGWNKQVGRKYFSDLLNTSRLKICKKGGNKASMLFYYRLQGKWMKSK